MNRKFNHISSNFKNLNKNFPFQFAKRFALKIFNSNSIYTFIPKNACSTMRLSLAIENGLIEDESDFNWIHHNNDAFRSDLESLCAATYTFVIMRCPFARLASAYLDKIVGHEIENWEFHVLTKRRYNLSDISFERFVKEIKDGNLLFENMHWRPQTSFMIYEQYDDYFCLEDFNSLENTLNKKIGFTVVDARNLVQYGSHEINIVDNIPDPHLLSNFNLLDLKRKGKLPHHKSLYTEELISIVKDLYKNDLNLYRNKFGSTNLMFN